MQEIFKFSDIKFVLKKLLFVMKNYFLFIKLLTFVLLKLQANKQ